MTHFWRFARSMLQYRLLLAITLAAAVVDALCAFGGFGTLMLVIDELLGKAGSVQNLLLQWTQDPNIQRWIGDQSHLVTLLPQSPYLGFALLLGVIGLLAVAGSLFRVIYNYGAITAAYRTTMDIRRAAFQRLVHVPALMLNDHQISDKVSRLVRDSGQIARGLQTLLGKAIRNILFGIVCLIMALCVDWVLTVIFMAGLVPITILIRKFGKAIRRASRRAMGGYGTMLGAVQESLGALEVVKVHQAEGYERRRFNSLNREVYEAEMNARKTRAISAPVVEVFAMFGVIAVALIAGWWVFDTNGRTEATSLVKVLLMLGVAGASLRPLANLNNDLNEAAAASGRIQKILELPIEYDRHARRPTARLQRHEESVRFEQVSFFYPKADHPAVELVDLQIPFGKTIAIVGPNGAGKSTLLNLLPRILTPTKGRILIDETNIESISLRSLRSQIAVVPQQSVIFDGTVVENITYGRRHVLRQNVEQAGAAAFVHEFVQDLPNGYETHISRGGLSGGQQQRICLARAILRDPAILILDEATSQIDADSEEKINQALGAFCRGRTTFIIAHRLSTVVQADQIIVMDEGRLVDRGQHGELVQRCPTYQLLTRTQLQPPAA